MDSGDPWSSLGTNQAPTGRRKGLGLQESRRSTQPATRRFASRASFSPDSGSSDSDSESEHDGDRRAWRYKKMYREKYKRMYMEKCKEQDEKLQQSLVTVQEKNKKLQESLDREQKPLAKTNVMLVVLGCLQGGGAWWLCRENPALAIELLETMSAPPIVLGLTKMAVAWRVSRQPGGGAVGEGAVGGEDQTKRAT
jgi:hypothetical protein